MNVNLGERLDKFVGDLVKSGLYQSHSEVVRESLRLLREREELHRVRLAELRKDLQEGLDDLDHGRKVPAKQVFDELRALSAAKRRDKRVMDIEFSQRARNDLTDIWWYIAEDSVDAADRMRDEIERTVQMLARQPESGRQRDGEMHGLRSFSVGKYLVFYRVRAGILEIVRVVHGMQDLPSIFSED